MTSISLSLTREMFYYLVNRINETGEESIEAHIRNLIKEEMINSKEEV